MILSKVVIFLVHSADHADSTEQSQLEAFLETGDVEAFQLSAWGADLFKIDHGMIRQIEANFITVPYRMPSPWCAP